MGLSYQDERQILKTLRNSSLEDADFNDRSVPLIFDQDIITNNLMDDNGDVENLIGD